MPITFSFPATSVSEIQKHFNDASNFISSNAYVQMAQPVDENCPPFCLMLFLTDCKFTSSNIYKRWMYQATELKKNGIRIHNIATDGDSRPLMAMKCLSKIGISDPLYFNCEWFSCGGKVETTFTQDLTHIITKLRNRLLLFSRMFPLGPSIISKSHLQYLIDNVSKDKHLLVHSDLDSSDRQNFLSAEKICSDKVVQCLVDHVPGSEGTVLYLKAMNRMLNSFMNVKITSSERISLLWSSVFFFRAWRSWINACEEKITIEGKSKNYYNLKDNFISVNCYTCIELDAHALVKKVMAEESDSDSDSEGSYSNHSFIPNLYSSQPCESVFRQMRSITSTYSTVVSCNMLEMIFRMKKIQLQNDIISDSKEEIKFPRFEKKSTKASHLSDCHRMKNLKRASIILIIENARDTVISELESLSIDTSKLDFHCQVTPVPESKLLDIDFDSFFDDESDSDYDEMEFNNETFYPDSDPEDDIQCLNSLSGNCLLSSYFMKITYLPHDILGITGEDLILKDYNNTGSENNIDLDEKSPFAVVMTNQGKEMVVRKSSICWLLSKDKCKLSSDRLQRVQEREYAGRQGAGNLKFMGALGYTSIFFLIGGNNSTPDTKEFKVNEDLLVGEWCAFYGSVGQDESNSEDQDNEIVLIGLVLSFAYTNGKTFKEREYSRAFASVKSAGGRKVGMLCSTYTYDTQGKLWSVPGERHKFTAIGKYIATIKAPTYSCKNLSISKDVLIELRNL